jgi:hypothetical protein
MRRCVVRCAAACGVALCSHRIGVLLLHDLFGLYVRAGGAILK